MNELRFLNLLFGRWKWIPVIGMLLTPLCLFAQVQILAAEYPQVPVYEYVCNVLPVFAGVWPALYLRDAVTTRSGELYFHWRHSPFSWIGRIFVLIFVFALIGLFVAWACLYSYGPLGAGFVFRYVLFCVLYGCMGFFAMWITREITWALFGLLLFLLVHGFGRLVQDLPWNPYRDSIHYYFEAVSVHHALVCIGWSAAFLLLFSIALRQGRIIR